MVNNQLQNQISRRILERIDKLRTYLLPKINSNELLSHTENDSNENFIRKLNQFKDSIPSMRFLTREKTKIIIVLGSIIHNNYLFATGPATQPPTSAGGRCRG